MTAIDVKNYFPLKTPRKSQLILLEEILKVFSEGKSIVILEAPVGSGKSAIAITLANIFKENLCHIITPRKALQDQYWEDFKDFVVLMKGRSSYPCTIDLENRQYLPIIKSIKEGKVQNTPDKGSSCAEAPCLGNPGVYQECNSSRPCPYNAAVEVAQNNSIVIHNCHSFIYQTAFSSRFEKRGLLIADEAHELEGIVRSFITKKIIVKSIVSSQDAGKIKSPLEWIEFLLQEKNVPEETEFDKAKKRVDENYVSPREEYLRKVESLEEKGSFDKGMSVEVTPLFKPGMTAQAGTTLEFIPHHVGNAVTTLLLNYGEKVLLMSGTIYSKELFCKNLGISTEQAHFIRIGSSFPKENRPIYAKPQYRVDTSHANWDANFGEMITKIRKIMDIFKDAKGLIHAPSYLAASHIVAALGSPRVVTHSAADFSSSLEEFYKSPDPEVFVSPVCQQGVDFKEDRARFQIILRVPYMSTGAKFVEDKVKNDFPWYNYQALIVFGQQVGRVNRSETDYGATFLMDERFVKFIRKNSKVLPSWLKDAIIWS